MKAQNHTLLSLQQVVEDEEEQQPHILSFRHLPTSGSSSPAPPARPDLLFQFSAPLPAGEAHSAYHNDIFFCGKIIHDDEQEELGGDDDQVLNEYEKRDYFATARSKSLRKPSSPDSDRRRLSASTRFSGELSQPKRDVDYHVQRVNITALTSMSAKSRRRMFMFGPVKFKPEMELAAIKHRQTKLPAVAAADSDGGGWKGQQGMLKSSLRGRSHFKSVLGCIPVAGNGGVKRRLGAAS